MSSSAFEKYERAGAYHWRECDPASPIYNPPLEARYRIVAQRVPAAQRVVDVGCGDGYLMSLLGSAAAGVWGIEYEAAGVALAKSQLEPWPRCHVVRGSSYQIPFAPRSFDLATMTDVIEHLENPEEALAEVARVLVPRGALLLTTPKKRPDRVWDVHHVTEYEPDVLAAMLRRHFAHVQLSFFWPLRWSNLYNTRLGWHAIRVLARHIPNPFLRHGLEPGRFGQILAICSREAA